MESVEQIKEAVQQLPLEEKKRFLLDALPELGREAMDDQGFLLQLLPAMLKLLQEKGLDPQQLAMILQGYNQSSGQGG